MTAEDLTPRGWRAVEPPQRAVLLVNPSSGNGVAARLGLVERAQHLGIRAVAIAPGEDLEQLVQAAVDGGADALGMAGGDGSLAVVAAAAAEHDLPFICIPAGTRNHFALDLGVDRRDVLGALDAFVGGFERHVDLADVNGHPFLNNVSLGIYGEAVRHTGYRDAKARILVETAATVLAPHGAVPPLRVVDDVGHEHDHTAVVLVSNNPYSLTRPPAGTRPRLDGGELGVLVLDAPGPGTRPPGRTWSTPSLELHAAARVHAGIDGEAVDLDPLLRFTIRPRALRVRISRHHPGISPSARPLRAGSGPAVADPGARS